MMDRRTRQFVRERAGNRCEYCQLPQQFSPVAQLQIEHIIPRKLMPWINAKEVE